MKQIMPNSRVSSSPARAPPNPKFPKFKPAKHSKESSPLEAAKPKVALEEVTPQEAASGAVYNRNNNQNK